MGTLRTVQGVNAKDKGYDTNDWIEDWSFGVLDLDEDKKKNEWKRLAEEQRLKPREAPTLDDSQRRRAAEKKMVNKSKGGRASTTLTETEGNYLG